MRRQLQLVSLRQANDMLRGRHYLGPTSRGFALRFGDAVLVLANPTSRRLPQREWLELTRWCLTGEKNQGSQMWAATVRWLRRYRAQTECIVSYSDPSVGHTGALYRASNWLWAPTWHRLRPPPTGNGKWDAETRQAVKDRWVYVLTPSPRLADLLAVQDVSITRTMPWASFTLPRGADWKRWSSHAA